MSCSKVRSVLEEARDNEDAGRHVLIERVDRTDNVLPNRRITGDIVPTTLSNLFREIREARRSEAATVGGKSTVNSNHGTDDPAALGLTSEAFIDCKNGVKLASNQSMSENGNDNTVESETRTGTLKIPLLRGFSRPNATSNGMLKLISSLSRSTISRSSFSRSSFSRSSSQNLSDFSSSLSNSFSMSFKKRFSSTNSSQSSLILLEADGCVLLNEILRIYPRLSKHLMQLATPSYRSELLMINNKTLQRSTNYVYNLIAYHLNGLLRWFKDPERGIDRCEWKLVFRKHKGNFFVQEVVPKGGKDTGEIITTSSNEKKSSGIGIGSENESKTESKSDERARKKDQEPPRKKQGRSRSEDQNESSRSNDKKNEEEREGIRKQIDELYEMANDPANLSLTEIEIRESEATRDHEREKERRSNSKKRSKKSNCRSEAEVDETENLVETVQGTLLDLADFSVEQKVNAQAKSVNNKRVSIKQASSSYYSTLDHKPVGSTPRQRHTALDNEQEFWSSLMHISKTVRHYSEFGNSIGGLYGSSRIRSGSRASSSASTTPKNMFTAAQTISKNTARSTYSAKNLLESLSKNAAPPRSSSANAIMPRNPLAFGVHALPGSSSRSALGIGALPGAPFRPSLLSESTRKHQKALPTRKLVEAVTTSCRDIMQHAARLDDPENAKDDAEFIDREVGAISREVQKAQQRNLGEGITASDEARSSSLWPRSSSQGPCRGLRRSCIVEAGALAKAPLSLIPDVCRAHLDETVCKARLREGAFFCDANILNYANVAATTSAGESQNVSTDNAGTSSSRPMTGPANATVASNGNEHGSDNRETTKKRAHTKDDNMRRTDGNMDIIRRDLVQHCIRYVKENRFQAEVLDVGMVNEIDSSDESDDPENFFPTRRVNCPHEEWKLVSQSPGECPANPRESLQSRFEKTRTTFKGMWMKNNTHGKTSKGTNNTETVRDPLLKSDSSISQGDHPKLERTHRLVIRSSYFNDPLRTSTTEIAPSVAISHDTDPDYVELSLLDLKKARNLYSNSSVEIHSSEMMKFE